MPDPLSVDAAVKLVTSAANQSDRWLFVALLLIMLLAIYWMAKWFMARNDALQSRVDTIQKDFNAFLQTSYVAVSNNIQLNTDSMQKQQAVFTEVVKVLDSTQIVLKQALEQTKANQQK